MSNTVVTSDYGRDLEEASALLSKLLADREALEIHIAKQKRRVAALQELIRTDEIGPPKPSGLVDGITDACRVVFRAAEKALYPIEVRDRVEKLGLPPQTNLLASVHTIIRRLRDANEILEVFEPVQSGGSTVAAYRWRGAQAELIARGNAIVHGDIGTPPSIDNAVERRLKKT